MSRASSKSIRRQIRHSKKSTTPLGYLASDEFTFIPSDTSDTSDWEWIAGGSLCRDVARERFISDSYKTQNQDGITLNPSSKPTPRDQSVRSQAEHTPNSQLPDSQDNLTNPTEEDTMTDFPVYEKVDSADETTPTTVLSNKPGNDPPIIRRSNRNVGPPKFYGKKFFIDVVDLPQATSGSASNPIVLENGDYNNQEFNNSVTPLE